MNKLLLCQACVFLVLLLFACQSNPPADTHTGSADSLTAVVHPAWSSQATVYEVNLRQYTPEGTFVAFEKSLPRLKELGVDILWFMPINPIGIVGRKSKPSDLGSYYAVRNYNEVNPEYGTMDDWKELVKKAHEMGFKVILDWVPNHTSPDNPWITKHPDFYKKDSTGKPAIPYNWDDTRQLNYDNREMRDSMIAAMKFWINETDIDGFRCDVAWNVPNDFWKETIPQLRKIKPLFMLAEGDSPGLNENGFDATYPWNVMNIAYGIYPGKTTVRQLDSVINHNDSVYPKNAYRMYFTTNHDENSWNGTEFERFGNAYKTFALWAFTMGKSVPMIYSGQEEPNKNRLRFFVKDTIHWSKYELMPFYETLIALRHSEPALSGDASFSRIKTEKDDAIYSYIRENKGSKLIVVLNLSPKEQKFKIPDGRIAGESKNIFSGSSEKNDSEKIFDLQPWAYLVYDYNVK